MKKDKKLQGDVIKAVIDLLNSRKDDWKMTEMVGSATTTPAFNVFIEEDLMIRKDEYGTRRDKCKTMVSDKGVPLMYRGVALNAYSWDEESLSEMSRLVAEIADTFHEREIRKVMGMENANAGSEPTRDANGNLIEIDPETGEINVIQEEKNDDQENDIKKSD